MQAEINQPPSGLLRIPAAAAIVGIPPRAFYGAILDAEIPISLVRLGTLHYVRGAELFAWLRAPAPAAANLFI